MFGKRSVYEPGGRVARYHGQQYDLTAQPLYDLGLGQDAIGVILSLDPNIWLQPGEQRCRRLFVEDRYPVDRSKRIEYPSPVLLGHHRTARTLGAAYRSIRVEADHQRVTERSGLIEQADVASVQQVEAAAGCDKPAAGPAYSSGDLKRIR
jgi:hypothetical protein